MRRLLLSLGAVSLLAACSGGDDDGTNPNPQSITLAASANSGTIARGASGTTVLTVGRVNGYGGNVSFTTEGAPTGVTVAFVPAVLSGAALNTTATITVASTAAPGNATLTFRATGSGVTDQTVQYALTVPTPAITVSLGAGTATAAQGATATVPVTITRTGGATGAVNLTAEGLPANVTAAFAPASIPDGSTTSTLTLTVGANATVATSPIVVRAASAGVTDQTATVQLTVTAAGTPAYTITAAPAALSVIAGQPGTSTLTIAKSGGFAGNVTLGLEGQPAGVAGTFTPNPATGTTSTLSLTTTAATVPGVYNLTVRGAAAGLTDRTITIALTVTGPPAVTLTLVPTTLSIAQGGSAQSVITLARVGGLTGDVTLTASGAPAGVTVAFAPATVLAAANSSTVTVTAGAAVAAGTYNLTITAAAPGNVTGTATLPVTVTVASGFSLSATNVTVAQGGTIASTITITRTGGYAGAVQLNATNVPNNVTASFNPISATGNTSTLTLVAAVGAVVGTYTITVSGTGPNATNQSTTLTIGITASGGGGGNIAWRFCDPTRVPLWFAFRNGTAGAWTQVTPSANNTFSFTLTGASGGVSYVANESGGGTVGTIYLLSTADMTTQASNECSQNPTGKSLTGTVAGLTSALQSATITVGGAAAAPTFASPAYSLTDVNDGVTDLLAVRSTTTINGTSVSIVPDRAVVRRNVNYPAGSAIPVIDLAGAESFALGTATATLANAGTDNTNLITTFFTGNGGSGNFFGVTGLTAGTSVTQYGVPAALTQAGDFHMVLAGATSLDALNFRALYQFNRNLADRTFTFGAVLNTPTTTSQTPSPYGRLRTRGTWQAEYGMYVNVNYSPQTGVSRMWTLSATRDYFGAASTEFELELYDFSGVGGFNNAWGLPTGVATTATTTAYSALLAPAEGNAFKTATRRQTVTP